MQPGILSTFNTNLSFSESLRASLRMLPGLDQHFQKDAFARETNMDDVVDDQHNDNLFTRDCNTNIKLSWAWPAHRFTQDEFPTIDPLQDLAVALLVHALIPTTVTTGNLNVEQEYHVFLVEFWSDPSQLPYPHSHWVTYLLPDVRINRYIMLTTPSFHSTAARPDFVPGYVPSLVSQIMVLELLSYHESVIVVIDMAIFSEQVIHSDMPDEIPWSDWGPQYTLCFPHQESYRIIMFGGKMSYTLPRSCIPEPGETLEGLGDQSPLICKPGQFTWSFLIANMISNHLHTATVC
ncbi:hypothetical protein K503DRAFT_860288, partial [Rhizopogon vinicolor AM-OR11-026]